VIKRIAAFEKYIANQFSGSLGRADVVRRDNSNPVICNWVGHAGIPKDEPSVFELTPKKAVWKVRNPKLKMTS